MKPETIDNAKVPALYDVSWGQSNFNSSRLYTKKGIPNGVYIHKPISNSSMQPIDF